jgi:hypothetical protein
MKEDPQRIPLFLERAQRRKEERLETFEISDAGKKR